MSLRFALLAVLSAEPMTGYDLLQFFDASVAFIWHAPHSNIYPELRRMEARACSTPTSSLAGARRQAAVSLTERGYEELHSQASRVVSPAASVTPTACGRPTWSGPPGGGARAAASAPRALRALGAAWVSNLEEIRGGARFAGQALGEARRGSRRDRCLQGVRLRGLVERAHLEVDWARRGLALIDRLEAAGWSGHPAPPQARRGRRSPDRVDLGVTRMPPRGTAGRAG